MEAAAARGHHLAGGEGDQAEPGKPRHQQRGEGHPDEVLAVQWPRQASVPPDSPDPGEVTKEKTSEVSLAPNTAVKVCRVSILVYFWCPSFLSRFCQLYILLNPRGERTVDMIQHVC